MTIDEVIAMFDLQPLPMEGGFFRETYRASEILSRASLSERFNSDRNISTAIYYLLTPEVFSAFHRLKSDEIYHFYLGDPVALVKLFPDGDSQTITLGTDVLEGQQVQVVVEQDVWQALYLKPGGSWALLGATVAPGFDFSDYEHGNWETLLKQFPKYHKAIMKLTRK